MKCPNCGEKPYFTFTNEEETEVWKECLNCGYVSFVIDVEKPFKPGEIFAEDIASE